VQTLREIGAGLGRSADVRGWTAEHPWAALSTAAAAGFATTVVLIPSKRGRALRRLAEIEKALHPAPESAPSTASPEPGPAVPKPTLASMLLRELAKTLVGLAFGAASEALGRLTESQNGQSDAEHS
jgi:hypothetical protein